MDPALLVPFLLAVLLIELTPGPNMGYLAIVAGQWGRRAGFATVLGVTAGLTVYMLAAVFGLSEIILRVGWLYDLLRWAGVAFLLWLAFDTWRGGAPDPGSAEDVRPSRTSLMTRGFLANVLNPKAAVFYIALLPGFTDPRRDFASQALMLGLIHIAVSLVVHSGIVLGAARAQRYVAAGGAVRRTRLRIAFALALAAIAAWLAWETRR